MKWIQVRNLNLSMVKKLKLVNHVSLKLVQNLSLQKKKFLFKETVVQNPSKPEGTRTVLKEGKVGKETTTTTYTLDTKTGKVTPDTKTTVVKAEDRLVEVGTGKNVTGDVETQYVPDTELEPGQSKVVQ